MVCFLCKKSYFEIIYSLKNKDIIRCKNDYLFFSKNYKNERLYGKNYYENLPDLALNNNYYLKKFEKIKKLTGENKPKILDVGCGWGNFLRVLNKQKIPYLGIDINSEAIKICKTKGFNCSKATIEELANRNRLSFSAITMFQVIEHLKNPVPILLSAKKLLKKNGVILITTPNNNSPLRKIFQSKWSVYNESSHFVFYNKDNLTKTLRSSDFKKVVVRIDFWRYFSLSYILYRFGNIFQIKIPHLIISNSKKIILPTDPWGDLEAIATN